MCVCSLPHPGFPQCCSFESSFQIFAGRWHKQKVLPKTDRTQNTPNTRALFRILAGLSVPILKGFLIAPHYSTRRSGCQGAFRILSKKFLHCKWTGTVFTKRNCLAQWDEICSCGWNQIPPPLLPSGGASHEGISSVGDGRAPCKEGFSKKAPTKSMLFLWGEIWDSNPWPSGPQPDALTNCANPTVCGGEIPRWRALGDSNPRPTA